MTAAKTLESKTSLTPKLLSVSRNISSAKAIAGNKLQVNVTFDLEILFEIHVNRTWDHAVCECIGPIARIIRCTPTDVFPHAAEGMDTESIPHGLSLFGILEHKALKAVMVS
jgi:hypothetical protein